MSLEERKEGIGLKQEEERPREGWRQLTAKRQLLTQANEEKSPGCVPFPQRPLEWGGVPPGLLISVFYSFLPGLTVLNTFYIRTVRPPLHLYISETIVSQNNTYPYDP